jgi:hypothetical protein
MIRLRRCCGALVIFISIQARAEPIMNVRRMFTGMNHLRINQKLITREKWGGGREEFQKYERAELTSFPNCLK